MASNIHWRLLKIYLYHVSKELWGRLGSGINVSMYLTTSYSCLKLFAIIVERVKTFNTFNTTTKTNHLRHEYDVVRNIETLIHLPNRPRIPCSHLLFYSKEINYNNFTKRLISNVSIRKQKCPLKLSCIELVWVGHPTVPLPHNFPLNPGTGRLVAQTRPRSNQMDTQQLPGCHDNRVWWRPVSHATWCATFTSWSLQVRTVGDYWSRLL